MAQVPVRQRTPDDEIDHYLRGERVRAALRILWIGALALALGAAGTLLVFRWWVEGGAIPNLVLAGPLALVAGVPLTGYGLLSLLRATRG